MLTVKIGLRLVICGALTVLSIRTVCGAEPGVSGNQHQIATCQLTAEDTKFIADMTIEFDEQGNYLWRATSTSKGVSPEITTIKTNRYQGDLFIGDRYLREAYYDEPLPSQIKSEYAEARALADQVNTYLTIKFRIQTIERLERLGLISRTGKSVIADNEIGLFRIDHSLISSDKGYSVFGINREGVVLRKELYGSQDGTVPSSSFTCSSLIRSPRAEYGFDFSSVVSPRFLQTVNRDTLRVRKISMTDNLVVDGHHVASPIRIGVFRQSRAIIAERVSSQQDAKKRWVVITELKGPIGSKNLIIYQGPDDLPPPIPIKGWRETAPGGLESRVQGKRAIEWKSASPFSQSATPVISTYVAWASDDIKTLLISTGTDAAEMDSVLRSLMEKQEQLISGQ